MYHPHFKYRTIEEFAKGELIKHAEKKLLEKNKEITFKEEDVTLEYDHDKKRMKVLLKNNLASITYYCHVQQNANSYHYVYDLDEMIVFTHGKYEKPLRKDEKTNPTPFNPYIN